MKDISKIKEVRKHLSEIHRRPQGYPQTWSRGSQKRTYGLSVFLLNNSIL